MSGTVLRVLIDMLAALAAVAIAGWVAYRLLRFVWSAVEELTS